MMIREQKAPAYKIEKQKRYRELNNVDKQKLLSLYLGKAAKQ